MFHLEKRIEPFPLNEEWCDTRNSLVWFSSGGKSRINAWSSWELDFSSQGSTFWHLELHNNWAGGKRKHWLLATVVGMDEMTTTLPSKPYIWFFSFCDFDFLWGHRIVGNMGLNPPTPTSNFHSCLWSLVHALPTRKNTIKEMFQWLLLKIEGKKKIKGPMLN